MAQDARSRPPGIKYAAGFDPAHVSRRADPSASPSPSAHLSRSRLAPPGRSDAAMSLRLVYIGAAAGLAPAASLRALAGGGAVFVPAGARRRAPRPHRGGGRPRRRPAPRARPGRRGRPRDLLRSAAAGARRHVAAGRPARAAARAPAARARAAAAGAAPAPARSSTVPAGAVVRRRPASARSWSRSSASSTCCACSARGTASRRRTDIVSYTVEEVYELADAVAAGDGGASTASSATCCCRSCFSPSAAASRAPATSAAWRRHRGQAHPPPPAHLRRRRRRHAGRGQEPLGAHQGASRRAARASSTTCPASFPALLQARKLQQRAGERRLRLGLGRRGVPQDRRGARRAGRAVRRGGASSAAGSGAGPARPRADPDRHDPRVPHEVGDLLFATVNVARLLHVDPELALREASRALRAARHRRGGSWPRRRASTGLR